MVAVEDEAAALLRERAAEGALEDVRLLLAAGADPNGRDEAGDTAATLAARHDHADVVRALRAFAGTKVAALYPRVPFAPEGVCLKATANHRSGFAVVSFRALADVLDAILQHMHAMENATFPLLTSAFTATVLLFADEAVLMDVLTANAAACRCPGRAAVRVPAMTFKLRSPENVLANVGADEALTVLTVEAVNRVLRGIGAAEDWAARRRAYKLCASVASRYVEALARFATPCGADGLCAWATMAVGQDPRRYAMTFEKAPVLVTLGQPPAPSEVEVIVTGTARGTDVADVVDGAEVLCVRIEPGAMVVHSGRIGGPAWMRTEHVRAQDLILLPLNLYDIMACGTLRVRRR